MDSEEQAKIAKSGLEMKLITSEMDAETDKWQESGTQIEVSIFFFIKHHVLTANFHFSLL